MDHHPAPLVTPTGEPFWTGLAQGIITIQRCTACGAHVFYPRVRCPSCLAAQLEWVQVRGEGVIYSFAVCHLPTLSAFEGHPPQILAVVELDEGVRMTSTIETSKPEGVMVGARVAAVIAGDQPEDRLLRFRLLPPAPPP